MTNFNELGLIEPLLHAVSNEGYTTPTPIQAGSIPHILTGGDLLGIAQTGTGKTAAFALPVLQRLAENAQRPPRFGTRCLVLAPTRELAVQIDTCFATYGRGLRLRRATVFGGVGMKPQINALTQGVDILVATPGRLIDLMNQGFAKLETTEILILDEADRMFDMGFSRDVKRIVSTMTMKRQTLLFSATMPNEIVSLAQGILREYKRVEVTPVSSTAERIEQKIMFVDRNDKRPLLVDLLNKVPNGGRSIIFARTKHGADRVAEFLTRDGIQADAIHGNKSQNARQRVLESFRRGKLRALVATDIAARGIDVDGVTHVINFDLPDDPESYVHRIGRTARAGNEGIALSLCEADDIVNLRAIQKMIRQTIEIDARHDWHSEAVAKAPPVPRKRGQNRGQRPNDGQRPQSTHARQGQSENPRGFVKGPRADKGRQGRPQRRDAA